MLQSLLCEADRFVVVDVETTGLYNLDRVVEVAAVTVDGGGRIVDEWDTLVDPQRDVGPTHIHGVTASMVSAAPTFEEVAAALADRLYGGVLVAHNVSFDARMLTNEFDRMGARFVPGDGVCTLRLGGGKLADVCRSCGVELSHAHRALGDARATAKLLPRLASSDTKPRSSARVFDVSVPYNSRTLQREMVSAEETPMPYLARLAAQVHHYGTHGAALAYLDMLDWALADLVITDQERTDLEGLAADLGLTPADLEQAHLHYVDELVAAAVRDEVVSDDEYELLNRTAAALGVDRARVDEATEAWRPDSAGAVELQPGMRVCFTGAATYPDGTELPRAKLKTIAGDLGLKPTKGVTKKGCDILIAADPASQSGKADKARKYDIPIVDVQDLLLAHPGSAVPMAADPRPSQATPLPPQPGGRMGPPPPTRPAPPSPRAGDRLDGPPGHVDGRHFSAWVDEVKRLRRDGQVDGAEGLLLQLVAATEAEAYAASHGVAPWYYEQLAILYRKQDRIADEVAILERFSREPHAPGVKPPKLLERLDKARARLNSPE